MFVERLNSKQNRICSARIAWKVRCQIRGFKFTDANDVTLTFLGGNFKHQYLPHYPIFLGKNLQTWSVEPTEHFGIYFGYIQRLFQRRVSPFNDESVPIALPPANGGVPIDLPPQSKFLRRGPAHSSSIASSALHRPSRLSPAPTLLPLPSPPPPAASWASSPPPPISVQLARPTTAVRLNFVCSARRMTWTGGRHANRLSARGNLTGCEQFNRFNSCRLVVVGGSMWWSWFSGKPTVLVSSI